MEKNKSGAAITIGNIRIIASKNKKKQTMTSKLKTMNFVIRIVSLLIYVQLIVIKMYEEIEKKRRGISISMGFLFIISCNAKNLHILYGQTPLFVGGRALLIGVPLLLQ